MNQDQGQEVPSHFVINEAGSQHLHVHYGGTADRVPARQQALPPASPPWWKTPNALISGLILTAIVALVGYIFEVDRRIGRLEHTVGRLETDVKRIILALEGYGIDVPEYVQNDDRYQAESD